MKRTNILFAIADDASHMSAYGHNFLNTPSFDRVADEGVRFTRAFTTNPKCAPSRASILTGRHTWQLEEACLHWNNFPKKWSVFPEVLEDAGYHVGFTGKGWAPGDWESFEWEHNPAGKEYSSIRLKAPEGTCINSCDYTANFVDFLNQKDDNKPFCFWYGCYEPHRPYTFGEGVKGKDIADVDVPEYYPDNEAVRTDLMDYAREVEWFDMHLGNMLKILEDRGELDNTLIIVTSDNGMPFPRVKGQMYDDDFKLPLAVRWGAGCHGGRVVDDFVSFRDFAPTICMVAGVEVPETMTGRDFMKVLKSREDGVVDSGCNHILMGRERHDMGREGDLGYPVRCLRNDQWLYVWNCAPDRWPSGNPETGYTDIDSSPTKEAVLSAKENGEDKYWQLCMAKRPEHELFDIRNDPHCLNNLALYEENKEIVNSLHNQLLVELREQGDPRLDDPDYFEGKRYVGGAKHSWAHYLDGTWQKQRY
jgi:N-sulfoglucosamine sulfohydrolase